MTPLPPYRDRGARALVLLQDAALREFVATWREAKARNLSLPAVEDPDYQSLDALLRHLLRAARGYMVWMCEQLGLPDPGIEPVPDDVAADPEAYMDHVLERWRTPLAGVEEKAFHEKLYRSRWGVEYCIDAMMEHAAIHPMRHTLQLRELMGTPHPSS